MGGVHMPEVIQTIGPQLMQAEFEKLKQRSWSLSETYGRFFGTAYSSRLLNEPMGQDHARGIENKTTTFMEIEQNIARSHRFLGTTTELLKKSPDAVVDLLYNALLLRDADFTGKAGYVRELKEGKPMEQVVHSIIDGPEYREKAIIRLYNELLGRAPDEGGYKDKFQSGKSISAMAKEMRASQEYKNKK